MGKKGFFFFFYIKSIYYSATCNPELCLNVQTDGNVNLSAAPTFYHPEYSKRNYVLLPPSHLPTAPLHRDLILHFSAHRQDFWLLIARLHKRRPAPLRIVGTVIIVEFELMCLL